MRSLVKLLMACCLMVAACSVRAAEVTPVAPLRPPAVPLVAMDPYFSVWSCADRLTDDTTRHWTRTPQELTSLIRIDGKAYRLMGNEPKEVPALPQVNLQVLPTRTIYDFEGNGTHVTLTFTTPSLPDSLDVLARPVTYLTWDVRSVDGNPHQAALYFHNSAQLAVNTPDQRVVWSRRTIGDLTALRIGTDEQPVLQKKGDDLRIDWGYVYAAAPQNNAKAAISSFDECTKAFLNSGSLPAVDDQLMPRAANNEHPVSAFVFELGNVTAAPVSRHLLLAYDDLYSIMYFRRMLRPYWRRNGADANDLLQSAERDYESLQRRCQQFDTEMMADLNAAGGERYARLCALSYRQTLAANKLVADANGQPLLFSKENFSNGCIATVDISYPQLPQFLLFSPTLAKACLVPVLAYSASERWKFPFAPHDLGTYPLANGQVYGGGEKTEENQMPVEESGNMLIMMAAIARMDGNANFAKPYWPQLTQWARYLEAKGFDPESQLSTDDFAGHLAHNVNLSVKAIEALGSYGILCEMRGDRASARRYRNLAAGMVSKWLQAADDGDHYRLAFDKAGTWSQKYNLVWDRLLDINLFPPTAIRKEMAFYRKSLNRYGLPLDNRQPYTKLDWTIWTATLAESPDDFHALVTPVYDFVNATPDRVPLTDWYQTREPRHVGFQARSVVGGVFIKMLADPAMWKKWSSRDLTLARRVTYNWAPLPVPPQIQDVVASGQRAPVTWRYTTQNPGPNWYQPNFNAANWQEGPAGFGRADTPGAVARTPWASDDIWLRREFTLPAGNFSNVQLSLHHDEDAEVYINGVLAARVSGYTSDYELIPISPAARATLKPGQNTIAVHCHQTRGGQYIDVGIVNVVAR